MSATSFTAHADYLDGVRRAETAAAAYYEGIDALLMADADYDDLIRALAAYEAEHPEYEPSAVTTEVAAGVGAGTIAHLHPMLSLDNAMNEAELAAFLEGLPGIVGARPELTTEVKLDGMAVSAVYRVNPDTGEATFEQLVTRGDGSVGEDATDSAVRCPSILKTIPDNPSLRGVTRFEVRGEAVLTRSQFAEANVARIASGKEAFVNARNAMNGTLRSSTATAHYTFVAYQLGPDSTITERHSDDMAILRDLGFTTAADISPVVGPYPGDMDAIWAAVTEIGAQRIGLDCGIDGVVIKVDRYADQATAGMRSKSPRWAIAFKFPPEERTSIVREIDISVGRTGALSIRALFDTVFVGEANVSAATLHNPTHIATLGGIGIGDTVIVRRAGDVVPEVAGVVTGNRAAGFEPWDAPVNCPRCHTPFDQTGKIWRCPNGRACATTEAVTYAVGRDCLDIKGLGRDNVAGLVEAGLVSDIADLFALDLAGLASVIGEANAVKALARIETARKLPLNKIFCSLGVRLTGRSMSRRIARHFGTMDAILAADYGTWMGIEKIGDVRTEMILAELTELRPVIDRLIALGINMVEEVDTAAVATEGPLVGKKVVITGSIPGLSRSGAGEAAERLGATVSGSVSKTTDILIVGEGGGGKRAKAESLGVAVMDGDEFATLVAASAS